jgi:hypothetical protein
LAKALNLKTCFVAGTLVHTREGLRPIESVQVGDCVLTRDQHNRSAENVYRPVLQTFVNPAHELLHLGSRTKGEVERIVCTPTHPFYVPAKGRFLRADELEVGDQLTLADGGTCRIDWIDRSHAAADQPTIVYNFEVEQHHTYFVGRAAIWVHNDDYSDLLSKVSRAKTPESAADAAAKELGNLIRDKGAKAEDVLSDATKLKAELFPDAADFNPKSIAAKAEELAPSNVRTGTVWDSIKATQPVYEGTVIPRSFELTTANGKVWVGGNATKHLAEEATANLARGVAPDLVKITTQAELKSLEAAVSRAAGEGIEYGKMVNVGGWELIFKAPRQPGQLPALIHALYKR